MWRLWDIRTGHQLLTLPAGGTTLQFRRDDGCTAMDLSLDRMRLYRYAAGREFSTLPHRGANSQSGFLDMTNAQLHKDGRLLALSVREGIVLVDLERLTEAGFIPVSGTGVIAFASSGDSLLTHGAEGVLRWPLRFAHGDDNSVSIGPPVQLDPQPIRFGRSTPDGSVISLITEEEVQVLRLSEGKRLAIGPQEDVRYCALSPDGRWIATGSHFLHRGDGCKVWDAATGRHVANIPVGGACAVRFSPDGEWLATNSGGARIWKTGTWKEGPALGAPDNPNCAFSTDGKLLALGDAPGVIRLLEPGTWREVARLTAPVATRLLPKCFTPDGGKLVAVGLDSEALHVFDLRAIRVGLRELGLDWETEGDLPGAAPTAARPEPLQVKIEMGEQLSTQQASAMIDSAQQYEQSGEYAKAVATLRQAAQKFPKVATVHNNLAWLLLTGPAELRNPQEALKHARAAAERVPGEYLFQNTLGLALYRNGQYAQAVDVLEKSVREAGAKPAFDLYILAMCHHRLGHTQQAKDCQERATRWFHEHRDGLPRGWVTELTAFQSETEKLLTSAP
jgi:hypothetical protein